jgi:anti-sigma28 factor (negative regulator of flagellin synthesis)
MVYDGQFSRDERKRWNIWLQCDVCSLRGFVSVGGCVSIKVVSVGSHLYLISTQQSRHPSRRTGRTAQSLFWADRVMRLMYLAVIRWLDTMEQSIPEKRSVRVAKLRAQIQIGSYSIDSITLVRCILVNETHFFDAPGVIVFVSQFRSTHCVIPMRLVRVACLPIFAARSSDAVTLKERPC